MQARMSIFTPKNTPQTNNSTSHYQNNGYSNNQSERMSQSYTIHQNGSPSLQTKIGSNRLQYKYDIIQQSLKGLLPQWKNDCMPASIVCRRETLHLSSVEFRLEDYYLIRNKKLSSHYQKKIVEVINYSSFNKELLDIPVEKLHSYSKQPSLSEQMIVREKSKFSQADRMNNLNRMVGSNGVNNSISSFLGGKDNTSSNNMFSNNRTNNTPNIFGNNSTANTSSYGNSSVQVSNNQNDGSSTGNIFANNSNTNSSSNNLFMRKSNSSNTSGGLFNSNSNCVKRFDNNGNNLTIDQGSSNIFMSRGNNTNNTNPTSGNNFSNNNASSLSNNINSVNNPSNNTSGGNMFNKDSTNTNMNTSYNNNNSSYNYTGNNNNFASNSHQTNIDINSFMLSFQSYLQNTQSYLQHLNSQNNLRQKQKDQEKKQLKIDKKDVQLEMRQFQEQNCYKQELNQQQRRFNISKRRDQDDSIVIILRKPKQLIQHQKAQKIFNEQFQNIPNNQIYNQTKIIINQTIHKNPSPKIKQTNFNKSVRMANMLPNKSIRLNNPRDDFNSMIYSRYDLTVNQTKTREIKQLLDEPCNCTVKLQIFWYEFEKKEDKIQIKLPTVRTFSIEVSRFDMQSENGRKEFQSELKNKSVWVKSDAKFIPDRRTIVIDHNNNSITISGRLQQKIFNLELEQKGSSVPKYSVQYSKITDNHIYNLAISRKGKGTIVWQEPITFGTLDFKKHNIFFIEDCEIGCDMPELQGPCTITFETLHPSIQKVLKSSGIMQAKYNLQKMLQKMSEDIQFGELWENGSWCFKLKKGFDK